MKVRKINIGLKMTIYVTNMFRIGAGVVRITTMFGFYDSKKSDSAPYFFEIFGLQNPNW